MQSFFILLALLCSVTGLNLTYPIKGVYLGYASINWADPGSVLKTAADEGYNLALISFYSAQPLEMLQAWDGMSQSKQTYLDYAHRYGMAVLMSAWIQQQYGDVISTPNATALGIQLAAQVTQRNFDGIDIVIREYGAGYTIGSQNSSSSITWVADLATSLRNALGPNAIITFSPYGGDWGPIGSNFAGGPGPLGGYTAIHPLISNLINHYNVFYFAVGAFCYIDYNSLFVTSPSTCPPGSTVEEIIANTGIDKNRLVVTKSIQSGVSGYMNTTMLHDIVDAANTSMGWKGGVVGWTWTASDNGTSEYWAQEIYPSSNITVIYPTTTIPTTTTTTTAKSTSTSTSTTGPLSTTTSVASSSTTFISSTGNPITGECGPNQARAANGECICSAGYYQSDKECKKTAILVIAVIVPIVVVAIIIVLLIFFIRLRGQQNAKKPKRLPSRTFSVDLESNYQSTNLVTEFESIVIKTRLGSGGSGVVNMGIWRHIEVAVKEFTNQDIETTDFIRESEIHAKLRHPNVVQLLAICLPPHMCTISEYMAKGSLADVLKDKPSSFTWKRKVQALHDIAKGMDYLHKSKIIHRDLKSQNCLIDKNWNCKIADFGTSKLVGDVNQTATAYVPRTAQWSAPEVIVRGDYSESSDVYSFGVIMWECLTGEVPYDGMFAFQVEDGTVKGKRLTIPQGSEEWFSSLMQQCWSENPAARPTFEGIITHIEKARTN